MQESLESSRDDEGVLHTTAYILDSFIEKLFAAPLAPRVKTTLAPVVDVHISEEDVLIICQLACFSLLEQSSLIRLEAHNLPAIIVGDLHGQFRDLRLLLARLGDPEEQTFVFLGDYVDRGSQGLETALLLLALKTRYPDRVILLRGNHEDINTSVAYGFYDECCRKYLRRGPAVWLHVMNTFNLLPISALLAGKVLCMHGGLSPHLLTLQDIENIKRPSIVPPYGLLCDLLWSDPDPENGSKSHGWTMSGRGISFSFDDRVVNAFCAANKVEVIVRAHQITPAMIHTGYMIGCQGRLITLFSAPNYVNTMNTSAVLKIDQEMRLRFVVFKPLRKNGQKTVDPSKAIMAATAD